MLRKNNFSKILFVVVIFVIGFQLGRLLQDNSSSDFAKVNEALTITKDYYYEEIDPDTLSSDAIQGILEHLDPHTVYIPKEIQSTIQEQMEGSFDGIGVEFQIIEDTITVVSPIMGGPSEKLGIQAGDKIIKIEDSSAIGFDNSDVIQRLRGEKGSEVRITLYRPSLKEINEYIIERDEIPLNSVETSIIIQDSVGYISLNRFAEKSYDELLSALNDLSDRGMEYLVLDLRNNPGGLLDQSVSISDLFIRDDRMIVYTKGRLAEFNEEFKASEKSKFENIPLIILINRGSASASEIVSGAVQDWDRGIIMGETTFGKGTVQRPFLLEDGSVLRLTISKYYTPSGRAIQRKYSSKEKYYKEIADRANDSTSIEHDSLDLKTNKYTTAKGRTVFGNGGIEPDYFVANEDVTKLTSLIRSKNLFYLFIRSQLDRNKLKLDDNVKSDLNNYLNSYVISNSLLNDFKSYIREAGVDIVESEFEADLDYIKDLLRAYIAKEIFNSKGWYSVLLNQDMPFIKALQLLNEAKSMSENN